MDWAAVIVLWCAGLIFTFFGYRIFKVIQYFRYVHFHKYLIGLLLAHYIHERIHYLLCVSVLGMRYVTELRSLIYLN